VGKKLGIIILAAGASSRFGGIKQLSLYHEKSFVRHAVLEALQIEKNTIVVLGANFDLVRSEISGLEAHIVFNNQWVEGMSSSIRCGLNALLHKDPEAEAAIFMVCDQPFVSSDLLQELIAKYSETSKPIVASAYQGSIGTPALFERSFFPVLRVLEGSAGAKKIIMENMSSTVTVPFPMGYMDIDTKEDYEALRKNQTNH
jgi:molybdenum cofactor cytidylyltransferase